MKRPLCAAWTAAAAELSSRNLPHSQLCGSVAPRRQIWETYRTLPPRVTPLQFSLYSQTPSTVPNGRKTSNKVLRT